MATPSTPLEFALRLQTSDYEHEQEQERCIRASSFLRHFMSLSGGFASRQYVASCYGSLHPNHWSLTSPGLVPATLAALPPTRAAPAHACSSFACQAVALAKAGASSLVCPLLLCPSCRKQPRARSRSMSFAASPRFRSSDNPNDVVILTIHPRRRRM